MAEKKAKSTKKTAARKSASTKRRTTKKNAKSTTTKSTAPKTRASKASKTSRKTKEKVTKKTKLKKRAKVVKSTKTVKSEAVIKEIKVGDLEKLYLPIAIIIAGLLIGCGLFGGLLYTNGSFGGSNEFECNSFEPLSSECLRKYAKDAGLKTSKFNKCVDDQTYYDAITADVDALKEYGIEGTPHVVVGEMQDGKLRGFYAGGAQGYDYYQALLDQVKEKGVDAAHESFIAENLGTVDDLTARYKEAYRAQYTAEELSDDEVNELSKLAAESRFESYGIKDYDVENSIKLGQDDAKIVMLEYSDYDCTYCQSFAEETFPQLKTNYIDTGDLLFVYKSLPLEDEPGQGYRAANAARCAYDQGKFLDYHNLLFGIEQEN